MQTQPANDTSETTLIAMGADAKKGISPGRASSRVAVVLLDDPTSLAARGRAQEM